MAPTSTAYATPTSLAECTLQTCPLSDATIQYLPNLGGNALYLALFALFLSIHLFLGIRYKTWGYLVGMTCGLALEMCGYGGRIWYRSQPFAEGPLVMYLVCITIAPAFISGSIYLCLGRIIQTYSDRISYLGPRAYALIFMISDFVALLLQSAGSAIASTSNVYSTIKVGIHIVIAGMAWQVASLLIFLALWCDFAVRAHRRERSTSSQKEVKWVELRSSSRFKAFQLALLLATLLILIRSVYRIAELANGFTGSVAQDQPLFMVLEGAMMVLAAGILTAFHPGIAFSGLWQDANWSLRRGRQDGTHNVQEQDVFED